VVTQKKALDTTDIAALPLREQGLDRLTGMMIELFHGEYDLNSALIGIGPYTNRDFYLVSPISAVELPDGRVIMVTNGTPTNAARADLVSHSTEGVLNVYIMRFEQGRWKVVARHEDIASMGADGHIGEVRWVTVGPNLPGFIVSSGGTEQGVRTTQATIFALDNGVRELGGFPQSFSFSGECPQEAGGDCENVDSSIEFVTGSKQQAYGDVIVHFWSSVRQVIEGKTVEVSTPSESARYQFDGETYRLIEGSNPVSGA